MRIYYAKRAIGQIPRILGNQDRNPLSPSYGCFERLYWLDKTSDFPTALAQYAVHSLALVYKYKFEDNPYYQKSKIKDWCIAGMKYWTKLQHRDGSFDEFYPFERGWAGPTGFLLYAMIESFELLKDEFPGEFKKNFLIAVEKAAEYLIKYNEINVLSNHHAMAALAVIKTYYLTKDKKYLEGFNKKLEEYKKHHTNEGWSYEYGGADPGYLSATVSFLAKIYQIHPSEEIFELIKSAVDFTSYFVYPNGFFAGTIGSRQTLHFYSHGYEVVAEKIPLAASIAEKMLMALGEGKVVPGEIMADRYLCYRVNEHLLSYLDYKPRSENLPKLPYERENFHKYFKKAKIFVFKEDNYYSLVNNAKGGVIKAFNLNNNNLACNDCGIMAELENGNRITSNWIENDFKISVGDFQLSIEGSLNKIPYKYFSPLKLILFRVILLAIGWNTFISIRLKGLVRKMIVVGKRNVPVKYKRFIKFNKNYIEIIDRIEICRNVKIKRMLLGDEFSVRFVPQSLYFQLQELDVTGKFLNKNDLKKLNTEKKIMVDRKINFREP